MVAKAPAVSPHRTVQRLDPVDASPRDYLTEREMALFCTVAKHGRHGAPDYAMVLFDYRHSLRVSELVEMRLDQLGWHTAHLWVARKKGGLSTQHPLDGDELRALRAWFHARERHPQRYRLHVSLSDRGPCTRQMFNYLVAAVGMRAGLLPHVYPPMLGYSCGDALANKGRDTRLIQDCLGHRNVPHTVRYTRTAAARFEGLWR